MLSNSITLSKKKKKKAQANPLHYWAGNSILDQAQLRPNYSGPFREYLTPKYNNIIFKIKKVQLSWQHARTLRSHGASTR